MKKVFFAMLAVCALAATTQKAFAEDCDQLRGQGDRAVDLGSIAEQAGYDAEAAMWYELAGKNYDLADAQCGSYSY